MSVPPELILTFERCLGLDSKHRAAIQAACEEQTSLEKVLARLKPGVDLLDQHFRDGDILEARSLNFLMLRVAFLEWKLSEALSKPGVGSVE